MRKNAQRATILFMTGLKNVVLCTLFILLNIIEQYYWAWVNPQSGVTSLNNIVDNSQQCGSTTLLKPVKLQAQSFSRVHSNSGQQLTSLASTLILQVLWITLFEADLTVQINLCHLVCQIVQQSGPYMNFNPMIENLGPKSAINEPNQY